MKIALLLQSVFGVELINKARDLFRRVDTDGDRELSAPELAHWLEKSAAHERKLISLDILRQYDLNSNGFVELSEMKQSVESQGAEILTKYIAKFEVADKDQSESLAPVEMEAFIFPEHSEWTLEFAKMTKLDRLDSDQDGNITFEEFAKRYNINLLEDTERVNAYQIHFDSYDTNDDGILDLSELDFYFSPNLTNYFHHQARQMIKDLETMNHNERLELPEVEQDPNLFYFSKIGESVRVYDEL